MLFRHLNVAGNINLVNLGRFRLTTDPKKEPQYLSFTAVIVGFLKQNKQVIFLHQKLVEKAMKDFLGIDTTPPSLERSSSAASKLNTELPTDLQMESLPLQELSSLTEEIHIKTREASQQTSLDMREFLAIDKALQSIQGELLNNTSKLTEINKRIKRDTKKLEEVENDPTYTDKQRPLYRNSLDDVNTEKQARPKILSQNRKDLQTQVPRIKQTLEKVLGKNTPLPERTRILIGEQIITIISTLSALLASIATIALSVIGDFGGGRGTGGSLLKDEGALKKWLDRLADALKRFAGKAVEALPAIVGAVVGLILSFPGKTTGFVAEHTLALILFVAGLVCWFLMQKVKKS